jgi:hypothetical protein
MTPYSDNGSTYIHQKINELAKTSGVIIISEYEKKAAVKAINKYKDLPKFELKSKLADVLDFMRTNYKELDLDNYNVKDDIEKYINRQANKVNKFKI